MHTNCKLAIMYLYEKIQRCDWNEFVSSTPSQSPHASSSLTNHIMSRTGELFFRLVIRQMQGQGQAKVYEANSKDSSGLAPLNT